MLAVSAITRPLAPIVTALSATFAPLTMAAAGCFLAARTTMFQAPLFVAVILATTHPQQLTETALSATHATL